MSCFIQSIARRIKSKLSLRVYFEEVSMGTSLIYWSGVDEVIVMSN